MFFNEIHEYKMFNLCDLKIYRDMLKTGNLQIYVLISMGSNSNLFMMSKFI